MCLALACASLLGACSHGAKKTPNASGSTKHVDASVAQRDAGPMSQAGASIVDGGSGTACQGSACAARPASAAVTSGGEARTARYVVRIGIGAPFPSGQVTSSGHSVTLGSSSAKERP